MKKTISLVLVLVLGLVVWPTPRVYGAQYLTVNRDDDDSIIVELGELCTIEVVSTDSMSYVRYVGFADGLVLGDFSPLQTTSEAGNLANVAERSVPYFYGYHVSATGFSPAPSPGVHFVFQYQAWQIGETDVQLYDETLVSVMDSVHITVIAASMGTAFTHQGRLIDAADGLYDFQFALYDDPDPNIGTQQGSTVFIDDLDVLDGYFTVQLDFADGEPNLYANTRWLEIAVRPADSTYINDFLTLSPRQELTPAPYALFTASSSPEPGGRQGDIIPVPILQSLGGGNTLDEAYDEGGPGAGRTIIADARAVNIAGTGGLRVNGNVGIGTTNPNDKLHVENSSGDNSIKVRSQNGGKSSLKLFESNDYGFEFLYDGLPDRLDLWSRRFAGNEDVRMSWLKNGNVGIGTETPERKLHIKANNPEIRFEESDKSGKKWHIAGYNSALVLSETQVADRMVIKPGGNVGIGTTSPDEKLTVDGVIKASTSVRLSAVRGLNTSERGDGVYGLSEGEWGNGVRGEARNGGRGVAGLARGLDSA